MVASKKSQNRDIVKPNGIKFPTKIFIGEIRDACIIDECFKIPYRCKPKLQSTLNLINKRK